MGLGLTLIGGRGRGQSATFRVTPALDHVLLGDIRCDPNFIPNRSSKMQPIAFEREDSSMWWYHEVRFNELRPNKNTELTNPNTTLI